MFLFHESARPQVLNLPGEQMDNLNSISSEWTYQFVKSNDWIVAVDEEFINDNFNYYGFSELVDDFQFAKRLIRGQYVDAPPSTPMSAVKRSATILYGMVHQRFLQSIQGVRAIKKKYDLGVYGTCPNVECNNQRLLPYGMSHLPGQSYAKGFCPSCQDIYETDSQLDGVFFGPYFAQYFLKIVKDVPTPKEQILPVMKFAGIEIKLRERTVVNAN